MKKLNQLLFTVSLLIAVQGCTDSSLLISDEELAVVWGFVYAGEPITDIKITRTLALDADTSAIYQPINDADVAVILNNKRFECDLAPGDSGYYQYLGNDLSIQTGDKVSIDINWNDQYITAKSTVPSPPDAVSLNSTILEIPNFTDPDSFFNWQNANNIDIEVKWNKDSDNDWYYVTIDCVEENPKLINDADDYVNFSEYGKFVFPPIKDTTYVIDFTFVKYVGAHEIKVYRVNQEYVDLFDSREQNSRDLNEPLTNVEGGLGVFSAFNSTKIKVTVVKK